MTFVLHLLLRPAAQKKSHLVDGVAHIAPAHLVLGQRQAGPRILKDKVVEATIRLRSLKKF